MKTNRIIITCLLLIVSGITFGQTQQDRLTRHVYTLAGDSLRGRKAGSEDAAKAAAYIVSQFEEIGIQPYYEEGWYQPFERSGKTYKNVIGIIPGNDPVLKDEYIIIGAHYDHLGVRDGQIYNGADDNASGTATIIEMARILKSQQNNLKRSIIVAAFDAEEIGLWGSNYLSEKLDLSKVKLMMSIDMVGWLEKGKTLRFEGVATVVDGKRLLREEAKKMHIDIKSKNFESSIFGATDTQGFAEKGVATWYVSTGLKSPYHKPEDDPELIDYKGLDRITDYMADVTMRCATDEDFAPSGKISPIHSGKRKAFEIEPTVSLVNGNIAFPKAGFDGKNRYGVNAGLMAQVNLSSHFALEMGAQYELLRAKFPDESDLFNAYLPYRQQSILIPANLLVRVGGAPGMDFLVEMGGFYGRVLNTQFAEEPELSIDPNQYGINWTIGFRFGKVKISGGRRYQLNSMFVGEGVPQARLHAGHFTIGYYF
ncbi:MAG: M20/M25/M40 family metallo-hydrolase [Bacteroidales bacterium]|nr:M20/M25/M40 family metallo-hydrolase [Bacteroidales bacterium]